jgi:DNA polymerase-3 subunit delta'
MLPIRLRPLPEAQVAAFLTDQTGAPPQDALRAARLGQGTIGRALGFLKTGKADGPLEETRSSARSLLEAALEPKATSRLRAALRESPAGARGAFSDTLESLTLWLRDLAAVSAGAEEVVVNSDATDWLRTQARRYPAAARGVPAALREVETTLQMAQWNINPQLALAGLLRRLHRRLS